MDLIYFIVSVLFIIGLFVLFFFFVLLKHQKRILQNKLNVETLRSQFENDKLKAQLQVQETTFQHISREIHDNVGQKLSLAKLQLNSIAAEHTDIIGNVVQMITDSLNDLRDLSRSLSADFIAGNGFIKTLENEIEQLNRSGLYRFRLVMIGESKFMKSEKEVILFRITQEALNNIIKHADATEITIRVHYQENELSIEIHDNGKGFDVSKASGSNGILNIQGRAKLLHGIASYQSEPGKGTTLILNIPYNESESDQNHDG